MHKAIELTCELIKRPSITPDDQGCQTLLANRLKPLGFYIESMPFADTHNLWAKIGNNNGPNLLFAGHTDVVATGPLSAWHSPPFSPTLTADGMLYGRGAADMKSGLAAMIIATENFLNQHSNFNGSLSFLITSDEEGPATHGTQQVLQELIKKRGENIDYCILGEPSSTESTGDTIKHGRRGSLSGQITIYGKQGHVAYPHLANNPLHQCLNALQQLSTQHWDTASADFPATSLQITRIHGGESQARNVTPAHVYIDFNLRFSNQITDKQIQEQVYNILDTNNLSYNIDWQINGQPFLTTDTSFINKIKDAVTQATRISPQLSTAGGTSDGRFIAPYGISVVELGVPNKTIHQVNECVHSQDIIMLSAIYEAVLEKILAKK
ncbi:Succinyl-diaminopimelate desuccinylase (plasmid) [Piscirickettsia salmonis]|uniref:Succinyl-diaminopimelate desuccinylase n=1 Tax=Piscirickettsia salmonis TaxID=1238 RepID=A0A6I5XXK7_PISSA|nr:succinyl-diaminopimelate desuccinylase [Piscirickettsia salmonis]ALB23129.1 succinyl-diaminopimelate desuccinylase [Piscirickettsia salmonis]ALY03060.1 succinyl-diaminopimelate desuccinylase [Piscirickettsia salmonis]AMA42618.1 succinyl-diaminopimelate desuccinylase [Piscirickettsia salmonis]AOS35088.1 succinyl-diaminopimelate desuccinylase [Piscirickettsia salmonis]APS59797.1 succinyl-diaminopimelate desuccinylase [Piscirickettsia salmonis]